MVRLLSLGLFSSVLNGLGFRAVQFSWFRVEISLGAVGYRFQQSSSKQAKTVVTTSD
jgi:hypothetical protein